MAHLIYKRTDKAEREMVHLPVFKYKHISVPNPVRCAQVWDIQDHTCLLTIRPKSHKIRGDLQAVHYSPISKAIAVATDQMAVLCLRHKWVDNGWLLEDMLTGFSWVLCVCFCVCAFCWRKFITTLRDNQHLDKQKNTKSISTTTPIPNTHPTSTQMMMIIKEICIVLVFHIRQKATTSTNEKEGQKPKVQTNMTVNVNTDNCGRHSGDKRRTEIQSKNKHSCKFEHGQLDNCGRHSGDERKTETQSKNKHDCKCYATRTIVATTVETKEGQKPKVRTKHSCKC